MADHANRLVAEQRESLSKGNLSFLRCLIKAKNSAEVEEQRVCANEP